MASIGSTAVHKIYTNVNGTIKAFTKIYSNVNGTLKEISTMSINFGGKLCVVFQNNSATVITPGTGGLLQ